jgi:putative membrane protein
MQIVRTVVWTIIVVALLTFSFFNWSPVEVYLWSDKVLETKLPVLMVIAFLLGLMPMWLVHRTQKWRMNRRVSALEAATAKLANVQVATSAPSLNADLPPEPANPVDPEK